MKARLLAVSTCLSVLVLPALAAAPLADRMPAGTLLYLGWAGRSLPLDGSMLGQMLNAPSAARLFGAVRDTLAATIDDGGAGEAVAEACRLANIAWQRPLAIGLLGLRESTPIPQPDAVLLIDLGDKRAAFDERLQALLAALDRKVVPTERTLGGVTYKTLKMAGLPEIGYGYLGNVFFATAGRAVPEKIIAVQADESLQAGEAFSRAYKSVSGTNEQLVLYVDVAGLNRSVEAALAAGSPGGTEPARNKRINEAAGVQRMTAIVGAARIVDRGLHTKLRVLTPRPHRGLLAAAAGAPLQKADLAHLPEDTSVVVAVNVSAQGAYSDLTALLKAFGVDMAGAMARLEKGMGLSFAREVLPHLGDTWVLASAPSYGGLLAGTIVTVEAADAAKLAAALGKIEPYVRKRRPDVTFESVRLNGAEVRYAQIPGKSRLPIAPAWAIHGGRLYLAAWPQAILSAIRGAGKTPLTEADSFKAFRAKTAGNASALVYVDGPQVLRQAYGPGLVLWTMAAKRLAARGRLPAKVDWLPALSVLEGHLWPQCTTVSSDADGITLESYGSLPSVGLLLAPLASPMGTMIAVPAVDKARIHQKRSASAVNLKAIGKALARYLGDHGRYPPHLDALVVGQAPYLDAAMLVSPASGREAPTVVEGKRVGEVDYVYVRPPDGKAPARAAAEVIVVYERSENYGDKGTNVLFADGHIQWLTMSDFKQAAARSKAPRLDPKPNPSGRGGP